MSLFSRKPKVELEEFCRDFYENFILNSISGTADVAEVFGNVVKESITEVDSKFVQIDVKRLADELTILRFELFALAWIHKFGLKSAMSQSFFTKRYLNEKAGNDIWDGMAHYNKAISSAIIAGLGKVNRASVLRLRADLAEEYIKSARKSGIDIEESMGRPINRFYSENAWKKGYIAASLVLKLCHRIGVGFGLDYPDLNEEAMERLSYFIRMLYDGARQSWDDIKIIEGEPAGGI